MKMYIDVEPTKWHKYLSKETGLSDRELKQFLVDAVPGIKSVRMASRVLSGASQLGLVDISWLSTSMKSESIDSFIKASGMWPKDVEKGGKRTLSLLS